MAKETIVSMCEYCKHNEGENKAHGFMWHCKPLGYCVPFGWHRCEAQHRGKGGFDLDEVKYKESKTKK